jgi:hypothetical protein
MGEAVMVTYDVAVFTGAELSVTVSVAVQVHAAGVARVPERARADSSPKFRLQE